jgi:hypothetical protein
MSAGGDYRVGYWRPPLETRFQKGKSGNPSGRPKGSRSVGAVIAAALLERVSVNENGRRRSITKLEAACKQLANKAAGGDQRAAKLIIELLHQSEVRDDARATTSAVTPEERRATDQAVLAAIRDRALGMEKGGGSDE